MTNSKADLAPSDKFLMILSVRLKKLRREHSLVEKAIVALTAVSQARESRHRQADRK